MILCKIDAGQTCQALELQPQRKPRPLRFVFSSCTNQKPYHGLIIIIFFLLSCLIFPAQSLPQVAVKCRPLTEREQGRDIVRVIENKVCGGFSFSFSAWFLEYKKYVDKVIGFVGGGCVGS